MRVSSQYKFIYLSNPRCGSTSIDSILWNYSDFGHEHSRDPIIKRASADQLRFHFNYMKENDDSEYDWDWNNYYKFTTVRNPWKKMVSYYFFTKPDKDNNFWMEKDKWDAKTEFHHGFNTWLKILMGDQRGLPNYEYFCLDHETKEKLVDDVFKLEEIDDTLLVKLKELGLDIEEIPKLDINGKVIGESDHNFSASTVLDDYYSLYNEESIKIIEQVYSSDIEEFNYSFGD